jgi:hypothetical protein
MDQMKRAVGLAALLLAFTALQPAAEASQATAAFKKLQSLAGDWEGKDSMGQISKTNFKLVVSGTAVLETLAPGGMEEMLSLYTVDKDSIALAHFCPTNNQPRMRAVPASDNVKQLVFSFQGAGNLPSESIGHQHKLVIDFADENHITETWTWREAGKDTIMVFHFTRKK